MPTPTYDLIASTTLAASTSTVTFGSLPSTYRDLILVLDTAGTSGVQGATIRLNNDSGSNYSSVDAQGTGSSTGSGTSSGTSAEIGVVTTDRVVIISQFLDSSATDKHKTFLSRASNASDRVRMTASRYASTSAITSILVSITGGNFSSGSTFNLYGVIS